MCSAPGRWLLIAQLRLQAVNLVGSGQASLPAGTQGNRGCMDQLPMQMLIFHDKVLR